MKKRIVYVGAMMAALLVWAACDRVFDWMLPSENEEAGEMQYVSFTDHGCQGQPLGKANAGDTPYLSNHRLNGDTLILTIHHWAMCCPGFVDSVSIHENTVDISIEDTLGCWCMCEYDNDFAFLYPSVGALRVRFGWIGAPFELDTLIHIP